MTRPMLAIALLWLTGCGSTHIPSCERTVHAVADDEVLPTGLTVSEVAATLTEPRQVPGTWADGSATEVSVSAVRAGGAAEWVDLEPVTIVRRGLPFGAEYHPMVLVACDDFVRFPVDLSLSSDDGDLDVHVRGRATSRALVDAVAVQIEVERPPGAIAGMPAFDDWFGDVTNRNGDPLVPDHAFVMVDVVDERTSGVLGWSGEYTLDDTSTFWAEYLLELGTDP